ncbi:glutathione S-transferase U17-like [Cornus florida]|uniref:glutathione S-transferase U17-like n=1 Tax=Cornus florida TaxID=4283 RepID=UPI0028A06C25|nr:glutathione S-transferase U17-like [Cornus florida]
MAMSDVKFLGTRPSPFANRVQIALNIKSVKYEFIEENLGSKRSGIYPSPRELSIAQEEEAKAAEQVVAGLVVLEEVFVKCSKENAFFGGDSFGYLDIWLRI